jgi:exopolysaccharide biosynthesis WecB/TagA/CpsF family protein
VARHQDPFQVTRRRLERLQEHLLSIRTAATESRAICEIDNLDLEAFSQTAAAFGFDRCAYVVTPNVDHLIRYCEDFSFRGLYRLAAYTLLDSRVAALASRFAGHTRLAVCPGSDLTAKLLGEVASAGDRVVMIGGTHLQAQALAARYGLRNVRHHCPPMGFIDNREATETCLRFIESQSPFRFCFLAVGSPQQEMLAQRVQARERARGLVLCVGAALNFLSGVERRAPRWMQRMALEWLFRLLQNPRRLGRRYLLRGPRFFAYLLSGRLVLRARAPGTPTRSAHEG